MIYLINRNTDPALNHGIEEYFMKETDEDVFSLWQNYNTILVGKNQDIFAEINMDYAKDKGLTIVRRRSGGGTIYCDLGNMQYSFITKDDKNISGIESFQEFAKPVVEALRNLGLNAEFTGRNDILLEGKKISGNAQYRNKGRIVHHGTLLYQTDTEMLKGALYSRPIKFKNKAVKSVFARVGEIKDFVDMDIKDFMDYVSSYIIDYYKIDKVLDYEDLDDEVKDKIEEYAKPFRDKEWNIGKDHNQNHASFSVKYPYGLVEYKLRAKDGKIESLYILGDYFEDEAVEKLAQGLIGVEVERDALEKALDAYEISDYIKGMDKETLIEDLLKTYK